MERCINPRFPVAQNSHNSHNLTTPLRFPDDDSAQ